MVSDVVALQLPTGRRSGQISQYSEPILREEALQAQDANIDVVSGATYTSDAYAQSLQAARFNALDARHRGHRADRARCRDGAKALLDHLSTEQKSGARLADERVAERPPHRVERSAGADERSGRRLEPADGQLVAAVEALARCRGDVVLARDAADGERERCDERAEGVSAQHDRGVREETMSLRARGQAGVQGAGLAGAAGQLDHRRCGRPRWARGARRCRRCCRPRRRDLGCGRPG